MSEIKHTPGPWSFGEVGPDGRLLIVGCERRRYVADVQVHQVPRDAGVFEEIERKANARLIAAAPELLWVVRLAISPFDGEPDYECPNWVKPARAAILKTTGEQA